MPEEQGMERNTVMLAREDADMVRFAADTNDTGYIKNRRIIRDKLLLYMANPNVAKINYNKMAKEFGCKPETIKRMRKSMSFQVELAQVTRDWLLQAGGGEVLHEAYRQLNKGVKMGKAWAVTTALRIGGVMGSKEVNHDNNKPDGYEKAVAAADGE